MNFENCIEMIFNGNRGSVNCGSLKWHYILLMFLSDLWTSKFTSVCARTFYRRRRKAGMSREQEAIVAVPGKG